MAMNSKKRKFLATSLTATMVAAAVAPTAGFAAEAKGAFPDVPSDHWAADAINYLVAKGAINGLPDGNYGPSQSISRAAMAKILAESLDNIKVVDGETPSFSDVSADHYAAKHIAALEKAGIVNGNDKGLFDPSGTLTREAAAKMIVEAYGLKLNEDADISFPDNKGWGADYINIVASLGILEGTDKGYANPTGDLSRAALAQLVYRAEVEDARVEVPKKEVKAPVVESVSAINGKTIEVKFSAAVDADTLKDAGGSDVISLVHGEGAKTDYGTVTQSLSADGKTLTLKATDDGAFFKGDYTVKVPFEVVKGTNGSFLAPVNAKVTVSDTVAPVLSSAKSTVKSDSDKVTTATLTFDEDVSSIEVVKVDGVNYDPELEGNTATIKGLSLDASKSYDVTVVNAKDAAGNVKDVQSAPLSITVDAVAPTITSVQATGESTVKITLNKNVGDSFVVSGKVGAYAADIGGTANVNPKNDKEYFLDLNSDYLFKNGNTDTVTLTVEKNSLTDALSNTNDADIIKTVTLSKDAVAPAVTSVTTTSDKGKVISFTVNFAEEVKSLDSTKVYVVNSKGEILSLTKVATLEIDSKDEKKVVFTLIDGVEADKYSFDLSEGFVTDKSLAANKSPKYSFTVDVTDASKPIETSFTIKDVTEGTEDNTFEVDFGVKVKATGTGSALNLTSYSVNGKSLPSDASVQFVKDDATGNVDQTKVLVTLPEGFVKINDTKAVFRVSNVQTLDNKTSNPFIKTVSVFDNTPPVAQSFAATDLNELTVTYSEAVEISINGDGIDDEVILYDNNGASIAIDSAKIVDGKLVITVTGDASTVTKLTTVKTSRVADIVDAAGIEQKTGVTLSK